MSLNINKFLTEAGYNVIKPHKLPTEMKYQVTGVL